MSTATLAAALAFHISMSPPAAPIPSTSEPGTADHKRLAIRATARFITAVLTKGFYWASAVTDTLVLLAPYVPTALPTLSDSPPSLSISIPPTSALLSWITPTLSGIGNGQGLPSSILLPCLPPLTLVTIVGTTLAITGALLRRAAYRALGQFYACPNLGPGPCKPHKSPRNHSHSQGHAHALITNGPYAFVRHPGYAGLVLCTTGLVVLHLDAPGTHASSRRLCVSVWMRTVALVCAFLSTVGAMGRIQDEERALKVRFKGEWEAWVERVQYRLVPGVH